MNDHGGGIALSDFDDGTDGWQVNLAEGENVITITVTALNGAPGIPEPCGGGAS